MRRTSSAEISAGVDAAEIAEAFAFAPSPEGAGVGEASTVLSEGRFCRRGSAQIAVRPVIARMISAFISPN